MLKRAWEYIWGMEWVGLFFRPRLYSWSDDPSDASKEVNANVVNLQEIRDAKTNTIDNSRLRGHQEPQEPA
jgi:hypothetical protein